MKAAALLGIVIPGNLEGNITAEQHTIEDVSERSPYTSWTRNEQVARGYANSRGTGGVLLRVSEGAPESEDSWFWEYSDDPWGEDEVLLRGIRMGLEVLKP
jgi:hypothetical protein